MLASSNPKSKNLVDPSCAVVANWNALVQSNDVSGVILATPPASHAAIARAAINAGKAVLIEKPLTLAVDEAEDLVIFAERQDAFVMVDHIHVYSAAFRGLCDQIQNHGSAIQTITSRAGAMGPFRPDTSVLWDWGPHDLSMCLALLGETPTTIRAERLAQRHTDEGGGETIKIELSFPSDITATITLSNIFAFKQRIFDVDTATRCYSYDDIAANKLTVTEKTANQTEAIAVDPVLPLNRVVETFVQGIQQNSHDRSGLEMGAEIVRILSQCQTQLDAVAGVAC